MSYKAHLCWTHVVSPTQEAASLAFRRHPLPPPRDPLLLSPGPQLSVKLAVIPASGVCGDPGGQLFRARCWVSGDSIFAEFWEEPRHSPLARDVRGEVTSREG